MRAHLLVWGWLLQSASCKQRGGVGWETRLRELTNLYNFSTVT
jgi:hypothetical protein